MDDDVVLPGRSKSRPRVGRGVMVDALAASDPAYPIVSAILKVVPASRWAFARVTAEGAAEKLLSSSAAAADLGELGSEIKRQRKQSKSGPRSAAALGAMGRYENGITPIFADARSTFGILTLLRSAGLGAFTSTEIGMPTLALDATSERLSVLRLHPDDGHIRSMVAKTGSRNRSDFIARVLGWECTPSGS